MAKFGISERQIAEGRCDALWQQFMKGQIERARRMLQAGAPLGRALPGRIGFEMRLIILGGERILFQLHESRGNMFQYRPQLQWRDALSMFWRALFARTSATRPSSSCSSGGCKH
jgi:phytoene/squalene synthetase